MEMRTKLALKNTITSLVLEIVTALSGIIVPRFFTMMYGSTVNGLVSSISQFITYMTLVEAGVSAAGIVELYKPLAENDDATINGILSAVKRFYYKSGILFILIDLCLIVLYPYIIHNEISDYSFIRMMIAVLSINGIVDYFILGKYRVLLTADQRNYIISFFQIIGTIIIMIVSIVLINANVNAIIVKAVAAVVYILRTLAIILYSKIKYTYLNFNVAPIKTVFNQRSAAFFHQIVGMICNNTDIILLTLLLKNGALIEVSIYSIYNYVSSALTSFFNAISTGIRASFGQIIAEKEFEILRKSYDLFEYVYIIVLFVIYTCMGTLLYSFIQLYSLDFSDSKNYPQWSLVVVFTFCGLIQNLRIPGSTIQVAAGHFKQTQTAAVIEALLNISISIILIFKFGIVGVVAGTCVSYAYRTTYILIYHEHHFLPGTLRTTLLRITRSLIASGILLFIFFINLPSNIHSWIQWILSAVIVTLLSAIFISGINMLFEKDNAHKVINIIGNTFH